MTNHTHLLLVSSDEEALARALKPLHMRYSQCLNHRFSRTGLNWQGRFFSSPLDEAYLWTALRYVECNPVRAAMVSRAEDYRWSSAAAHCKLRSDTLLKEETNWAKKFAEISSWSDWLSMVDDAQILKILRQNANKGLPCGTAEFIQSLELKAGRALESRPRGRPSKSIRGCKG